MPNFSAVLKSEITRLSRKEAKSESSALKRSSAQHRREIASLKRQVSALERAVKRLSATISQSEAHQLPPTKTSLTPTRFVPKGLTSTRKRLGLSQGALAELLGVSSASVFNWEKGVTRPRNEQLQKIIALRSVSKAQVEANLSQ